MQKDLLSELSGKTQRETAGADTASRFDYQKNWAFCEMLRRHMTGADYLVAFEFHDDVVFIETNSSPKKAEFYQVKTSKSSKSRTLPPFLTQKKGSGSVLGKMCMNFEGICREHDLQVILVSNIPFSFSDKNICANDLTKKYRDKIIEKLFVEIPSLTEANLTQIHFLITGVSIDAINSYLHGEVAELFKSKLGEDHGVNIHSWIRLIQGEIIKKNNFPSSDIKTSDELLEKKCISKSFISDSMNLFLKDHTAPPDMSLVNSALKLSGWNENSLMKLGKQIPIAIRDKFNPENTEVSLITNKIEELLLDEDLPNFIEDINMQKEKISGNSDLYSNKYYLFAHGVLIYYEKL